MDSGRGEGDNVMCALVDISVAFLAVLHCVSPYWFQLASFEAPSLHFVKRFALAFHRPCVHQNLTELWVPRSWDLMVQSVAGKTVQHTAAIEPESSKWTRAKKWI